MEPVHQAPQQEPKTTSPPVMDVVPPRPTPAAAPAPRPAAPVPAQPVQQPAQNVPVHTPPPTTPVVPAPSDKPDAPDKKQKQGDKKLASPKPARQPGTSSGVGVAIFATALIVLGLGAMFVYAYLRTNGISLW